MRITRGFYKKKGRWFNDDPNNGYDEADNEMVAGVPEVIEIFAGKDARKAVIDIDTEQFPDAVALELVNPDVGGGVEYRVDLGMDDRNPVIWLCCVFFTYYSEPQQQLYFKVR